jgi:DNA gyrase/topoisomerase IV subunit A
MDILASFMGNDDTMCLGCLLYRFNNKRAGGELIVGPETAAAYETGNGSVVLRATGHIEYEGSGSSGKKRGSSTKGKRGTATASAAGEAAEGAAAAAAGGKALVVFTEMPYQVCKVSNRACMCYTA